MVFRILCVLLYLGLTAEPNGDPLLYCSMWRSPLSIFAFLFDSLPIVKQPAWNVLLAVLAPIALAGPGAWRGRARPIDVALFASLGAVAFGFVLGVARGGSAYWAYYQLNAFLVGIFLAVLLLAAARSPRDLKLLGRTVLAAAVTRALLALYFFFAFVWGRDIYPPHMTSHHDSPLFAAGVTILVSWALARGGARAWLLAGGLALPILLAMKVNNRRLVWFELATALLMLYAVLPPGGVRRRMNRIGMVVAPVLLLYVAVGWGRSGPLFAPLKAFHSTTGQTQDPSTLARHEENMNLVVTFNQHPWLGSGWGQKFLIVSGYYANFGGVFDEMYPYTPHNSTMGLAAFSGLLGLIGILSPLPATAFLGARAALTARPRDAVLRAASMAAVAQLPAFAIQCFGDLGFQGATNGLLLAAAMCAAAKAAVWSGGWPTRGRAARPRGPASALRPRPRSSRGPAALQ